MTVTALVPWLCRGLLLALLILVGFTLPQLTFDNNILALFPSSEEVEGQSRADALRAHRVERRILLLIAADQPDLARQQALAAAAALDACECIASATAGGHADNSAAGIDSFYAGRTPLLLGDRVREQLARGEAGALQQRALARLLSEPGSGLAARLEQDPLGTLQDFRRRTRAAAANITVDDSGTPVVRDGERRFYLVHAELADSPYSLSLQAEAGALLDHIAARVEALPGGELLQAGSLFYTRAGTRTAQREVSTVGLGSLVGIVLLLLLVFRSPLLLLLAFVPIALGIVAGLAITWWVFGSVHVMAMVFGAALVGVAIDYSLHFFAKRHLAGRHWQARKGLQRLLPPLGLGLMTSSAAYLSFTTAGFPGFSQIAVLSATGLVTAFTVVVGLYPLLLAKPPARGLPAPLEHLLHRGVRLHQRGIARLSRPLMLLPVLVVLALAAFSWQSNDDIRQMQLPDPALAEMEQAVRQRLGATVELPYILVSAPAAETLLQRLEQLSPVLDAAVQDDHLQAYQSLAHWVPSAARQSANAELWQRELVDSGVLENLFAQLGVAPAARGRFLNREPAAPLRLTAIAPALQRLPQAPVYFSEDERHYSVVSLHGLNSPDNVQAAVEGLAFARWMDPVARTNLLLAEYRVTATGLLLGAYVLALLVLSVRYGLRGAAMVLVPPLLASSLALALIVLVVGQALSVFHLMALLLVLGIGVDYTLFLRESRRGALDTTLAIGLSTLTTVLSFGLLSLSATAAIHYFGLTVLLGILLAFLLAPLAVSRNT